MFEPYQIVCGEPEIVLENEEFIDVEAEIPMQARKNNT